MEEIIIEVEQRNSTGRVKVNSLRHQGFVPAVVYGEGKKALSLQISHRELVRVLHEYGLENVVISLKLKGEEKKKARACLIKDIQYHPVKGEIVHVDFHEISLTKAIKVNVPIAVKGEAVGVKQEGGSLEHVLWEVEVECLPTDIPKHLDVDVSALKIGDALHVKDIKVSAQIKVLSDPDAIIVMVAAPMKEEVAAEAVEGEEKKEPEVIKEKKEVPEEGKEGKEEKK